MGNHRIYNRWTPLTRSNRGCRYMGPDDNVLIIDGFLASGRTVFALADLVAKCKATVAGVGVLIEKVGARLCGEGPVCVQHGVCLSRHVPCTHPPP